MQEAARAALHDAETEWSDRLDAATAENVDLASRMQSTEHMLSKRATSREHEAELVSRAALPLPASPLLHACAETVVVVAQGESTAAALRRQCALLEKQLRRQESRTAAQQRDKLAAEKERDAYKHRIGSLESSTAAAWAASYAASQKVNQQQSKETRNAGLGGNGGGHGHVGMIAPGLAASAAATAAAKDTTSIVMTLPSPSKLRTASARSATLGTRSSEGMQSGSGGYFYTRNPQHHLIGQTFLTDCLWPGQPPALLLWCPRCRRPRPRAGVAIASRWTRLRLPIGLSQAPSTRARRFARKPSAGSKHPAGHDSRRRCAPPPIATRGFLLWCQTFPPLVLWEVWWRLFLERRCALMMMQWRRTLGTMIWI